MNIIGFGIQFAVPLAFLIYALRCPTLDRGPKWLPWAGAGFFGTSMISSVVTFAQHPDRYLEPLSAGIAAAIVYHMVTWGMRRHRAAQSCDCCDREVLHTRRVEPNGRSF